MKKRPIITTLAHELIKLYVSKDDTVIDATMGHGHDTLFLSSIAKEVYAFDIQASALKSTQEKLETLNIQNVTLILDSHEYILNYVNNFKGVLFNLGYLPKSDKSITTTKDVTIKTITLLLNHLPVDGFISLVIYPGHQAGYEESIAILEYLKTLDVKSYHIIKVDLPYQDNNPPYIIMIIKEKEDVT